jgi:hypothetical protein
LNQFEAAVGILREYVAVTARQYDRQAGMALA